MGRRVGPGQVSSGNLFSRTLIDPFPHLTLPTFPSKRQTARPRPAAVLVMKRPALPYLTHLALPTLSSSSPKQPNFKKMLADTEKPRHGLGLPLPHPPQRLRVRLVCCTNARCPMENRKGRGGWWGKHQTRRLEGSRCGFSCAILGKSYPFSEGSPSVGFLGPRASMHILAAYSRL